MRVSRAQGTSPRIDLDVLTGREGGRRGGRDTAVARISVFGTRYTAVARISVKRCKTQTYHSRFYAQAEVYSFTDHTEVSERKPARAAGRRAGDRRKGSYASNSWDRTTAEHGGRARVR